MLRNLHYKSHYSGKRHLMNCFLREERITQGIFIETLESIAFKMCSSHQSLDWDAFDIAWGKGMRGGDVEEVLLVCLYVHVCVCGGCMRGLL